MCCDVVDKLASWQLAKLGGSPPGRKVGRIKKVERHDGFNRIGGRRNGADAETGTRKREPVEMSR
jgi:hypothetical protein